MKRLYLLLVLFVVATFSMGANRTGIIPTGMTMLSPTMAMTVGDSVSTSGTVLFTISNAQKYMQFQVFTVTLDEISGNASVAITAYGKVTSASSYVQIGSPVTLTNDGTATITATEPINYNYLKVELVASGATQHSHITSFIVKTSNAYDIPANSGTLTVSRATSGTVTVTSKDDDANAALVVAAGGTGALTIGDATSTTAITSSDWAIDATGAATGIGDIASTGNLTNFTAYSTDVDGRSVYGKSTISSGFNTTGPVIGAGVFGRVNGTTPTLTAGTAYLGGTFGYYGITGSITNTHPKGGVIGVIGDGTTSADAAVVALLDGDTGTTTAGAAFGVRQTNSTGASGFTYGLDLKSGTIGSYLPVTYKTADIQVSSGAKIFTGSAANGNAVYSEVGAKDATGSIYISTAGALYIQVANAGSEADWYKVTSTNAD